MPYSLRRTRDDVGDSGQMSVAIHLNAGTDNEHLYEAFARPAVGVVMRVGSYYPRLFGQSDYWQTTIITEILEERTEEDGSEYVRFKTGNSEYVWTQQ